MIDKNNYLKLKKYLKCLSKPQIQDLINELNLNEEEVDLLLSWYSGDTRIKMSLDHFISPDTCTTYFKIILSKVYNYFKYRNISF